MTLANQLEKMFISASEKIDSKYETGTLAWINQHHSELSSERDQINNELHEIRKDVIDGKLPIFSFREILKEWAAIHIQLSNIVRENTKPTSNKPKVNTYKSVKKNKNISHIKNCIAGIKDI